MSQQVDESTGSKLVVFTDGAGNEHKWTMLSPSEFMRLGNQLVAERKAQLVANLKNAGVPWKEAADMLNGFDLQEVSRRDAMNYGLTDRGMPIVLRMGYECEKPDATDADVRALQLSPPVAATVVGQLMWLDMSDDKTPEEKQQAAAKAAANPLPGTAAAA